MGFFTSRPGLIATAGLAFLYLSGTLLPLSIDARAAMQVIVSLVVLGAALYVILSKKYPDDVQKWAFGVVGMIVGYWLPNGR